MHLFELAAQQNVLINRMQLKDGRNNSKFVRGAGASVAQLFLLFHVMAVLVNGKRLFVCFMIWRCLLRIVCKFGLNFLKIAVKKIFSEKIGKYSALFYPAGFQKMCGCIFVAFLSTFVNVCVFTQSNTPKYF